MPLLLKRLLLLAPIPCLVVATNLSVDPVHFFRDTGYESGIARQLLAGRNVTFAALRGNERLVYKHYVLLASRPPEVLVLGSSRSMGLHGSSFPSRSFRNLSVGGATLRDQIALTRLQLESSGPPALVVISADPWLLNAANGNYLWRTLETEYRLALRGWRAHDGPDAAAPDWLPGRPALLFDLRYFRFSLQRLLEALRGEGPAEYTLTDSPSARGYVIRADGSWSFPEAERSRSSAEVARRALYDLRQPLSYMGGFRRLDAQLQAELQALVRAWRRAGSRVVLFQAPYHPAVYRELTSAPAYRAVAEAADHFASLARREGLELFGSYDPAACGVAEADFFDGTHLREDALERLFLAARLDAPGR